MPPTTTIPVFDTAWQMMAKGTPAQAEKYAIKLRQVGFAGTWTFLLHHPNARIWDRFPGGGQLGFVDRGGNLRLHDDYVSHVRQILDRFATHGVKVGLGVAWQNSYLPGGDPNHGVAGLLHKDNAYAYGQHLWLAFGDHPAIAHWITGGDAGKNNTDDNIQVWRNFASGLADMGNSIPIAYHSPTSNGNENDPNNTFRHLNYRNEGGWLDIAGLETGHTQDAAQTRAELGIAVGVYGPKGIEVWQGEPRYTGYTGSGWPGANYGATEAVADAQAAKQAGVTGYVFGCWARWPWAGHGFNPDQPQDSFTAIENAVINVFAGSPPPPPPSGDKMRVDVLAAGQTGTEQLQVRTVSGPQGPIINVSTSEQVFVVDVPQDEVHTLQVEFTNDGRTSTGADRNARVVSVTVDGNVYPTVHPDVYSSGTWQPGVGCEPGYVQSEWLHCAGLFDFSEVIPPFGSPPPPPDCPPFTLVDFLEFAAQKGYTDSIRAILAMIDSQA